MNEYISDLKKNLSFHQSVKEYPELWEAFKKEYFIGDQDEYFDADIEAIFAMGYMIGFSEKMAKVADMYDSDEELEIILQNRND